MTFSDTHELSDHAVACLGCACADPANRPARMLLLYADAQTPTGVLAALFVAMAEGGTHLVDLARAAITDERARCTLDGRNGHSECPDRLLSAS